MPVDNSVKVGFCFLFCLLTLGNRSSWWYGDHCKTISRLTLSFLGFINFFKGNFFVASQLYGSLTNYVIVKRRLVIVFLWFLRPSNNHFWWFVCSKIEIWCSISYWNYNHNCGKTDRQSRGGLPYDEYKYFLWKSYIFLNYLNTGEILLNCLLCTLTK